MCAVIPVLFLGVIPAGHTSGHCGVSSSNILTHVAEPALTASGRWTVTKIFFIRPGWFDAKVYDTKYGYEISALQVKAGNFSHSIFCDRQDDSDMTG